MPPIGTSLTGTKWQIDLRTPVPGSVIEAFSWRVVRFHQTATSIAQQVLADGALAWQVAESDIPRSPSQPKAYQIAIGAQTASLRLWQTAPAAEPRVDLPRADDLRARPAGTLSPLGERPRWLDHR